MNFLNCLLDITDEALSWDITEDGFTDAVKIQACRMAGIHPEDMSQSLSD